MSPDTLQARVQGMVLAFGDKAPRIAPDVFIAPGSTIVGDVEIGDGSSIWFNCALRGDEAPIRIGAGSNLQDGTVVHVHGRKQGTYIGDRVTVGHMVLLHACTLEDGAYIGMGAQVMDEAVVEGGAMLAAGALLTQNKRIPEGELWAGRPARLMRKLDPEERERLAGTAEHYRERARQYLEKLRIQHP
jgi:carbonic anhydrase/acetyltransferase-like protein (isoleucine patch superfamily)